MEDLFEQKGRLSIVAARGWISASEAARLAPGALLVGDTIAGEGAELLYEGSRVAWGEVAILEEGGPAVCAFRITELERSPRDAEPERGDELTELLPFSAEVCEARYSLSELEGAGPGTVISLDADCADGLPARLLVAGLPAGEGRIVVAGERLGIRLDSAPAPGFVPSFERGTSALITDLDEASRAKVYDWRKPDRFTKAALVGLAALHEAALSELHSRVPALSGYRLGEFDQLAWFELAADAGSRSAKILRAAMTRPRRGYERERPRPAPARAFIEPERPRLALGPAAGASIARCLEEERARADERPLFLLASGGAEAAFGDADVLLDCLKAGWRRVCDYAFTDARRLDSIPVLRMGPGKATGDELGLFEGDMIAVVLLRGPGGSLLLAYSARAIDPIARALERFGRLRTPAS